MEYELKRLQQVQLEIAEELKRVCEKNNIEYFLVYGTCLGAIRHKGFIPWDDDIDVGMTIENYLKFIECKDDFGENYFLQTNETDKEYGLAIARLRKSDTTLIERQESHRDINHGIFVDVYPFYNVPKEEKGHRRAVYRSYLYRLMLYGKAPKNRGKIKRLGSKVLLFLTPKAIRRRIVKRMKSKLYNAKETGYLCPLYGGKEGKIYKKEIIFPTTVIKFENTEFAVPAKADKYLEITYGDYMTLPPEDKRVIHHDFQIIDFDKGYLEYKGKFYCKGKEK